MISYRRVVQWMNVIRDCANTPEQARLLENFWSSQMNSKMWLMESLQTHVTLPVNPNIAIYGGWYGILAQLLHDAYPTANIVSIDQDPLCEVNGQRLLLPGDRDGIKFITADMENCGEEGNTAHVIINTSTEHITQNVFDQWISCMPIHVPIVLQGNDFNTISEHIRCSDDLAMFKRMNQLDKYLMASQLSCGTFTRFMSIGYKHGKGK